MKKRNYVTSRGRTVKASPKQILVWTKSADRRLQSNPKDRRAKYLVRIRKQVEPIVSASIERKKKKAAAEQQIEEIVSEKQVQGSLVRALVGLKYDSKKKPFYAELQADIHFHDDGNYSSHDVLNLMKDIAEHSLREWIENSRAVGGILDSAHWITEGTDGIRRFGIISIEPRSSGESYIDWQFYATTGGKRSKIQNGRGENTLDQ